MFDARGERSRAMRMNSITERSAMAKLLAVSTLAVLSLPWGAARAEATTGGLTGVIRSADRTPLAGARLLAAVGADARVIRSGLTGDDGSFSLENLDPGTYLLAVEVEGGVYLVRDPVPVAAGARRVVQIAVGATPETGDASPAADPAADEATPGIWNNPFAAGGLVLGIAIVVGVLIKNVTDDEVFSSAN